MLETSQSVEIRDNKRLDLVQCKHGVLILNREGEIELLGSYAMSSCMN